MTRLLMLVTVVLAFLQPSRAGDVTVDMSKLTDFTTTVTFKVKNLVKDLEQTGDDMTDVPRDVQDLLDSDLVVHGKLIANIPGEKMKIKLDLSGRQPFGSGKDTFVLTFDGPKGYVAAEDSAAVALQPEGKGELSGMVCVKDKFNSAMIPPPEQIKAMIDQQAPMASSMANQMPHAVRGDLAYYTLCEGVCVGQGAGPPGPGPVGNLVLALHVADGTPAAFWPLGVITNPEEAADRVQGLTPAIKFGDFTEAEDFPEVPCAIPTTQLLDQPRSKLALFLAEQLLKRLQLAAPIAPATRHMFGQLPQVLRNTGKSCALPADAAIIQAATPVEPLGFLGIAAVSMVSAAVGAGIAVTAARRAFSKTEAVYMEIS